MRWLRTLAFGAFLFAWSTPAHASLQVMPMSFQAVNTGATAWAMIEGGNASWSTTEINREALASPAGQLLRMRIILDADPDNGAGTDTVTFTIRVDGANSALSCVISETATSCDISAKVALTAGQRVSLQAVPANTPEAVTGQAFFFFTPTTAGQTWLVFSTRGSNVSNTAENWLSAHGHILNATEATARNVMPDAYTCSNLYILLSGSPGTGNTYNFDVVINGGADSAVDCQVAEPATTCNSSADTVSGNAGDTISIEVQPASTPTARHVRGGMTCTLTSPEDFLLPFVHDSAESASVTEYWPINGSQITQAETLNDSLAFPMVIKALYVNLNTAPDNGAGTQSRTYTLRVNAAATGLTTTISESATTGSVTTYTVPIQFDDLIVTESTASNTPATSPGAISYLVTVGGSNLQGATLNAGVIQ